MQQKNIIICGNYGATNLGDETLLEGIIQLVRKVYPQVHITVMSSNPEETAKVHHIESVYLFPSGPRSFFRAFLRGEMKKTLKVLQQADGFILGGGGLFTDEKIQAILIWSLQSIIAFFKKKPLFCFGQSVGPLKTRFGRFMTKKIFSCAKIITVRDQASLQLLKTLKISRVLTLADPAFFVTPQGSSTPNKNLNRNPHQASLPRLFPPKAAKWEEYIVFTVRTWLQSDHKQHVILAKLIDWIYEEYGYGSIFIPFQILQDDDRTAFLKIQTHLQVKNVFLISDFSLEYQQILDLIAGAKATIGMRLHSLIFSTMVQTPFLALSYSEKVRAFAKDIELENFVYDWRNLELDELKKGFKKIMQEHANIQKKLEIKAQALKEVTGKYQNLLSEFLSIENIKFL